MNESSGAGSRALPSYKTPEIVELGNAIALTGMEAIGNYGDHPHPDGSWKVGVSANLALEYPAQPDPQFNDG